MCSSPRSHVSPTVGIANHRADRDHDDINEIVNPRPIDSGIFDFVKALNQRKDGGKVIDSTRFGLHDLGAGRRRGFEGFA